AVFHLVTTATIDRLAAASPTSRFAIPRLRPNVVVELPEETEGFPENEWVGHTLKLGDEVRIQVMEPCPRCVMTTLAQGDLPKDPNVLRTIVQQNQGNVGVLASVIHGGRIRVGDTLNVD